MSGINSITPGDIVQVDGDLGVFIREAISPYYPEEIAGINRCYVIFVHDDAGSQTSADWVLFDEMTLIEKGTAELIAVATSTAA